MVAFLLAQMPHGSCFLWDIPLTSLHVIADAVIVLSYFSIPALMFANRHLASPSGRPLLLMFAAFILSCGIGHLLQIWNIWHADYWLEGMSKAITALVSAYTAVQLKYMIPILFSTQKDLEISQGLVRTDTLTGLASRRALSQAIAFAIKDVGDRKTNYTLMLLDLDHFKAVNDRFGHPAGDRLLQQVSETILHHTRSLDLAARWGGDEFAILLSGCPFPEALVIADELRQAIASLEFSHEGKIHKSIVGASIGVAAIKAHMNLESIYHKVDRALYRSKHQGRNRVSGSSNDACF
jgi:diguanylate cyclase (GGDEF)-like protein